MIVTNTWEIDIYSQPFSQHKSREIFCVISNDNAFEMLEHAYDEPNIFMSGRFATSFELL